MVNQEYLSLKDETLLGDNQLIKNKSKLRLISLLYLLGGVSASSWGRFGQIFYNQNGMNADQIGVLEGISPCITVFSYLIWGYIADKIRNKKAVFILNTLLGTSILMLLTIYQISHNFKYTLIVIISKSIFESSGAIIDSYVLDLLGEKNIQKYGQYRLYLAISWGVGCFVMGIISDNLGFKYNFGIFGGTQLLYLILVAKFIPNQTDREKEINNQEVSLSHLFQSMWRPIIIFFIIQISLIGIAHSFVERLLFIYVINDLKGSTSLCGLQVLVTTISEIPIFYFSDKIFRYINHDYLIFISIICYILRVFGYTLLTSQTVYYILFLEILNGFTFACFWIAAVDISKKYAPKEWTATTQSILTAFYYSFGSGVGSIFGGWVIEQFGSVTLYQYSCLAMSIMLGLHIFLSIFCKLYYQRDGFYDIKSIQNWEHILPLSIKSQSDETQYTVTVIQND